MSPLVAAQQEHVRRRRSDATGDIIQAVARGDVVAFGSLYDEVAGLVYGIARHVVRDTALAEEVTQDVMLAIWEQAPRYDPERGSGRGWIATIAHRRAVDQVRSEQSARQRDDRYGRATVARPYDDVVDAVETRFDQRMVRAALAELPAAQRQAVTLAYFGGHTYREVAQMLDAPLGTVKTRIRDGLIRLGVALQPG